MCGVLTMLATAPALAQTYSVLHSFTGGDDGGQPTAGLTIDREENLYRTADMGGYTGEQCSLGCGVVFKLTHMNSGWVFSSLYRFHGPDGQTPEARVVFGPDGALYGTTNAGGTEGQGVVFRLSPPARICAHVSCPWTETVLHSFGASGGGVRPGNGDLVFDQAGNIYGTTFDGGSYGNGAVYEISPSNGVWAESIIYSFRGTSEDGEEPTAGVILDNAENLYGTTLVSRPDDAGTVYR
jgi:uncharacterized repeat protein (TIGR03803 family)